MRVTRYGSVGDDGRTVQYEYYVRTPSAPLPSHGGVIILVLVFATLRFTVVLSFVVVVVVVVVALYVCVAFQVFIDLFVLHIGIFVAFCCFMCVVIAYFLFCLC